MIERRSLPRLLLLAMVLGGIPALSLARQNLSSTDLVRVSLPANLSIESDTFKINTALHRISLADLAGEKDMQIGDVVYLHLNISSGADEDGVRRVNYPFAISQNRPLRSDAQTLSLRALVTGRQDAIIELQYLFEDLPYHRKVMRQLPDGSQQEATLILSVNHRAVGRVDSVEIDGQSFSIR